MRYLSDKRLKKRIHMPNSRSRIKECDAIEALRHIASNENEKVKNEVESAVWIYEIHQRG